MKQRTEQDYQKKRGTQQISRTCLSGDDKMSPMEKNSTILTVSQKEEIHSCLSIILGLTCVIGKNCKQDNGIRQRLDIIDSQVRRVEDFILKK